MFLTVLKISSNVKRLFSMYPKYRVFRRSICFGMFHCSKTESLFWKLSTLVWRICKWMIILLELIAFRTRFLIFVGYILRICKMSLMILVILRMFLPRAGRERHPRPKVECEILETWLLFLLLEEQRILLIKMLLKWTKNLELRGRRWSRRTGLVRSLMGIGLRLRDLSIVERKVSIEKRLFRRLRVNIVVICIRAMFRKKSKIKY